MFINLCSTLQCRLVGHVGYILGFGSPDLKSQMIQITSKVPQHLAQGLKASWVHIHLMMDGTNWGQLSPTFLVHGPSLRAAYLFFLKNLHNHLSKIVLSPYQLHDEWNELWRNCLKKVFDCFDTFLLKINGSFSKSGQSVFKKKGETCFQQRDGL